VVPNGKESIGGSYTDLTRIINSGNVRGHGKPGRPHAVAVGPIALRCVDDVWTSMWNSARIHSPAARLCQHFAGSAPPTESPDPAGAKESLAVD